MFALNMFSCVDQSDSFHGLAVKTGSIALQKFVKFQKRFFPCNQTADPINRNVFSATRQTELVHNSHSCCATVCQRLATISQVTSVSRPYSPLQAGPTPVSLSQPPTPCFNPRHAKHTSYLPTRLSDRNSLLIAFTAILR